MLLLHRVQWHWDTKGGRCLADRLAQKLGACNQQPPARHAAALVALQSYLGHTLVQFLQPMQLYSSTNTCTAPTQA